MSQALWGFNNTWRHICSESHLTSSFKLVTFNLFLRLWLTQVKLVVHYLFIIIIFILGNRDPEGGLEFEKNLQKVGYV